MPVFHHPRRVIIDEGGDSQAAAKLIPLAAVMLGAGIVAAIETALTWLEVALGALGVVPVPLVLLLPASLTFIAVGFIIGRRGSSIPPTPAPELPRRPVVSRVVAVGSPRRALPPSQGRARAATRANTGRTVPAAGPADQAREHHAGGAR